MGEEEGEGKTVWGWVCTSVATARPVPACASPGLTSLQRSSTQLGSKQGGYPAQKAHLDGLINDEEHAFS